MDFQTSNFLMSIKWKMASFNQIYQNELPEIFAYPQLANKGIQMESEYGNELLAVEWIHQIEDGIAKKELVKKMKEEKRLIKKEEVLIDVVKEIRDILKELLKK